MTVGDTEEKIMDQYGKDFSNYSTAGKFLLFILFFFIGIINHLGTILVMTGSRLLAYELNMRDYLTLYTSVATIFSVLTRVINSRLCLKTSYKKRIVIICFWKITGYLSMYAVLALHGSILQDKDVLCFLLSFIPCFFLGSSYAFGESAMLAYLRLFPDTLIAGWSSGTGFSGMVSGGLNFASQMVEKLSLKFMYLFLAVLGPVYLILFTLTYRILKSTERQTVRRNSLRPITRETNNNTISELNENKTDTGNENEKLEVIEEKKEEETKEEETKEENKDIEKKLIDEEPKFEEEEEDAQSIKQEDAKAMEDMNKSNKIMSCANYKEVMHMCGRVIINLGYIYFIQFFCVNTLIVRVCGKADIFFLPTGCNDNHHTYRKGKFEFVNLSYQLGMFLSKTFIKLIRKIQPIEVYSVSITIITILYIVEYYTGFFPWWSFLIIGVVLGIFSGGTYAGGFYTILNSDKVKKDYKELTVNVATLYNDNGTFLSGIVGYVALNYIFNDESAFDGQQVEPETC